MAKEKFNEDAFLDHGQCPYCGHGESIAGPARPDDLNHKIFRTFVCAECGKMFKVCYEPTSAYPKEDEEDDTTALEGLEEGLTGGFGGLPTGEDDE